MRKFADVARGEVIVRKEIGAEEQLDSLFKYTTWNSGFDLMELFPRSIVFILWNGGGRLRTFFSFKLVGSSHPVWKMQSVYNMTSPFFFGTILEIDGDMSRRDGTGGDT